MEILPALHFKPLQNSLPWQYAKPSLWIPQGTNQTPPLSARMWVWARKRRKWATEKPWVIVNAMGARGWWGLHGQKGSGCLDSPVLEVLPRGRESPPQSPSYKEHSRADQGKLSPLQTGNHIHRGLLMLRKSEHPRQRQWWLVCVWP